MKIVSIVGARPQFVKVWPIASCIDRHHGDCLVNHSIIHTGQHYTHAMSAAFFDELAIPEPTVNLGVGSGPHGAQTGQMMNELERVLEGARPDAVLVYGDTNSTLAGALAASKLHIPLVHVEAGLRSRDRRMPEEINRLVADHVSDLLLAPTAAAVENLELEGLANRTVWTGDVMYDAWVASRPLVRERLAATLRRFAVEPRQFALATVHRAGNVDDRLASVLEGLNTVAAGGLPVLFPVHPRTAKAIAANPQRGLDARLRLIDPVSYLEMLCLLDAAHVVLTDSGGLQKEAFFAGCPCITLREETEWVETVRWGANLVAGFDAGRIAGALRQWEDTMPQREALASRASQCFGEGRAAERTLAAVVQLYAGRGAPPARPMADAMTR